MVLMFLKDGFLSVSSKLDGIFKICLFHVKKQYKTYKIDIKLLQEYILGNNTHLSLKEIKIFHFRAIFRVYL